MGTMEPVNTEDSIENEMNLNDSLDGMAERTRDLFFFWRGHRLTLQLK